MHLRPECLVHTVFVMLIWMGQTIPEELRRKDQPHLWSWLSVSFLHSSEGTLRVSQTNPRFDPENLIKNKYTRSMLSVMSVVCLPCLCQYTLNVNQKILVEGGHGHPFPQPNLSLCLTNINPPYL